MAEDDHLLPQSPTDHPTSNLRDLDVSDPELLTSRLQRVSALSRLRSMVSNNPTSFTSFNVPPKMGVTVSDVLHHIQPNLRDTTLATSVVGTTIRILGDRLQNKAIFDKYGPKFDFINRFGKKVVIHVFFIEPTYRSSSPAAPLYRIRLANLVVEDKQERDEEVTASLAQLGMQHFTIEEESFNGFVSSNLVISATMISPAMQATLKDYYQNKYEPDELYLRPVNFCCFCLELYTKNVRHECEHSARFRGRSRGPSRKSLSKNQSRVASRGSSPDPPSTGAKGKEPEEETESPSRQTFGNINLTAALPPTPPSSYSSHTATIVSAISSPSGSRAPRPAPTAKPSYSTPLDTPAPPSRLLPSKGFDTATHSHQLGLQESSRSDRIIKQHNSGKRGR